MATNGFSSKGLCMYFCMDTGHLWCPRLRQLSLGKLYKEPLAGFNALYAHMLFPGRDGYT